MSKIVTSILLVGLCGFSGFTRTSDGIVPMAALIGVLYAGYRIGCYLTEPVSEKKVCLTEVTEKQLRLLQKENPEAFEKLLKAAKKVEEEVEQQKSKKEKDK